MANIVLPRVDRLDSIKESANILVEQDGSIKRFAVADLDVGGGDITVDLSNESIGASANNINADTLNGKYENQLFVANSAALNGYSANEYIRKDELNNFNPSLMELLWENTSPTSNFGSQTLALDLSGYKEILVLGRNAVSTQTAIGMSGYLTRIDIQSTSYYQLAGRPFDVSQTGILFKDNYLIENNGNVFVAPKVANELLQPTKIYGIKGVN